MESFCKLEQTMSLTEDIKNIGSVTFGIYSPEEIMGMSVCKIDSAKKIGPGTVYDPRMGTTDFAQVCSSCGESAKDCQGHFGRIELNEPIIHPLYYKNVESILKCICTSCSRLIITNEQIELNNIHNFNGEERFKKILDKISKISMCCQPTGEVDDDGDDILCGKIQPDIKYTQADCSISMVYVEGKSKTSIVLTTEEIKKILDHIPACDVRSMGFDPDLVHPRNYIISILPVLPPCDRPYVKADGKMCDDDLTLQYIEIVKLNNNLSRASENNAVPKRRTRGKGGRCKGGKKETDETRRQELLRSLRFRVHTTFNNSKGKCKHATNGRAIKSIKERLTGKDNQVRGNMMGKRVDFSARTVIGPDPTLKLGELSIPVQIAAILTIPVRVTAFNIHILQDLVDNGLVKSITKSDEKTVINISQYLRGTMLIFQDIIHRNPDFQPVFCKCIKCDRKNGEVGLQCLKNRCICSYTCFCEQGGICTECGCESVCNEVINVKNNKEKVRIGDKVKRGNEFLTRLKPANRKYKLFLGIIVHRQLQNGDYVLLNRQPTLHKGSMQAMKVCIKKNKTIRMNLAITKPFNGDFDGDEMNLHVPQGLESQVELKYQCTAECNIISAQSSKPNMAIVQDSLAAAYLMTKENKKITKCQFFDIACKLPSSVDESRMMSIEEIAARIQHIRRILKEKGKKLQCYNGRGIISLFLPDDLIYEKTNDAHPDEPTVKIWRGVLYEGTLNKSIVGSAHNSLIQVIHKDYGAAAAAHFIDCMQFSTNSYLTINGFSVGLGDCLIPQTVNENGVTKEQEIQDVIKKCYVEAEGIKTTTSHPGIREMRVNAALNKAKDIGLRIAKNALKQDNNFLTTVESGSKGDYFNIAQITGLLGQQNLKGARVKLTLNNGRRSLHHYPFEKLPMDMEYESRGFIDRGFLKGLNPRQFYFHAMAGREGICDTAMGTSKSGYMQRRIVKLTEDLKIHNDGSVRDAPGKIFQLSFGESGFDPVHTVKVKGKQEACDISRLIAKLNMKHELKSRKRKLEKKKSKKRLKKKLK